MTKTATLAALEWGYKRCPDCIWQAGNMESTLTSISKPDRKTSKLLECTFSWFLQEQQQNTTSALKLKHEREHFWKRKENISYLCKDMANAEIPNLLCH